MCCLVVVSVLVCVCVCCWCVCVCAARAVPIIQLLSTHHQEAIILRSAALCPARWQLLSITVGDGHLALGPSTLPHKVLARARPRVTTCAARICSCQAPGRGWLADVTHTGACAWGGEQAGTGWLLSPTGERERDQQQPAAGCSSTSPKPSLSSS